MKEVKDDKQNISNIKDLYKINADGSVPLLFREVKKMKQQAFLLVENFKKQLLAKLRLEEQTKTRASFANQLKEAQTQPANEAEKDLSFAELFNASNKPKNEDEKIFEQTNKVEQATPSASKELPSKQPAQSFSKPAVDKFANKPFAQKQNNVQSNRFAPKQQGFKPNSTFDKFANKKQFTPNQNSAPRAYSAGGFKKPFTPGAKPQFGAQNTQNNQNRSFMNSILPKKNAPLTSATSAFASKDRSLNARKKTEHDDERRINKKSLLRRGLIEEQNIEERMVTRKLKLKKPKEQVTPVVHAPITSATITTPNLTVKILSEKIGKPVTDILKQMMTLGLMANINSNIDFPTAELVASELGVTLELKIEKTFEEKLKEDMKNDADNLEKRSPIVTIVGHVDHGKTTLLDYIRKTHVTLGEAGGITQSIGAYLINWNGENITFVDTPGHEAFINMRKRGTEITDIAILIVAGDDGVKPQTVEAIKHIKEAKVPLIVAVTKIDKPNVDVEKIKQQLTNHDILPEEWGGDTIFVPVSSVTGQGIDKLLETILLVAEMQELKCNPQRDAVGTVVESSLDKNRGPVANVIVQNGTLKVGDNIVSGFALGKVRAIIDDKGKSIKQAGPSTPVSILGFDSVPSAGDTFSVVDEKFSKNLLEERKTKMAKEKMESGAAKSLDEFLSIQDGEEKKTLNIIIKADSHGSAEAVKQSLLEIKNEEVQIDVVACSVGNITENDIQLAKVSNATIISFDTKVLAKIANYAKQNKVEIREYNIIYKAIEDMELVLKRMMAPKFEEKICGHAEVRALFKISNVGTIAGSYVLDGKVVRNALVKVLRNDECIFEGKISTLKREKDDAREVAAGFECGIKIDGFNDIEVGDKLECVTKEQIFV